VWSAYGLVCWVSCVAHSVARRLVSSERRFVRCRLYGKELLVIRLVLVLSGAVVTAGSGAAPTGSGTKRQQRLQQRQGVGAAGRELWQLLQRQQQWTNSSSSSVVVANSGRSSRRLQVAGSL
jgi:hypothetical protein